MTPHRFTLAGAALAALVALGGCGRDERIPLPQTDTTPSTTSSDSTSSGTGTSGTTAPSTATVGGTDPSSTADRGGANPSGMTGATVIDTGPNTSTTGDAGTPGGLVASQPTGAIGSATTAPLPGPDQQFLAKAAEGGQFEVEVARLALEKATDPAVKTFAQMLVDDHSAANSQLRQIASSHNLALPASLPAEKKRELERLAQLSGDQFDRQFVEVAGIKDHHHHIAEFEKASQSAGSDDVKRFAANAVPTLKKHLAAAQRLPGGKG